MFSIPKNIIAFGGKFIYKNFIKDYKSIIISAYEAPADCKFKIAFVINAD